MIRSAESIRRILIVRLSSIGDVVHALPVAAALRRAYPNASISWLVEEMSAPIVEGSVAVDDLIVVPRARWKQNRFSSPKVWREYVQLLMDLKRRRFDISLDLQGYAKSAVYVAAAGAPVRWGWSQLRDGAQWVSRAAPRRADRPHRVECFLDTVAALGADADRVEFPLAVGPDAVCRARCLLTELGLSPGGYAVLNPGAGSRLRRWGARKFGELARGIAQEHGLPSILIGSARDADLCAEACSVADITGELAPRNAAGRTDLKELAALLMDCALQVCGDTGSAHIGAAVGSTVIGLYGPTDPTFAGPWGQADNVILHAGICDGNCRSMCDRATSRCMDAITVEEVLVKVGNLLHARR